MAYGWDNVRCTQFNSKNQNKICLQFIIAANACHVTQCQLFMFECGIASYSIAFQIRANAVRLINLISVAGKLCYAVSEHERTWHIDSRRSFALSDWAGSFASPQMECLNYYWMRWFIMEHDIDALVLLQIVANILVALKAGQEF